MRGLDCRPHLEAELFMLMQWHFDRSGHWQGPHSMRPSRANSVGHHPEGRGQGTAWGGRGSERGLISLGKLRWGVSG